MRKSGHQNFPHTSQSLEVQEFKNKQLRQIKPEHRFPCYSCFDKPIERLKCQACNTLGYITGDHPMVQFADDFLTQNLTKFMQSSMELGEEVHQEPKEKIQILEKKINANRKECRSAMQSYTEKEPDQSESGELNLMKSSNFGRKNQVSHYGFLCDGCECDPIKGIRFHCEECDDYDLCERCFTKGLHKKHKMTKIANVCKKSITPTEVVESLLKSMRNQ